jgi:hypothetical protein
MIDYIVKSTISFTILYLCSMYLIRKSINYRAIRILLLFFVFYSLVIPLFKFSLPDIYSQHKSGAQFFYKAFTSAENIYAPVLENSEKLGNNNLTTKILLIIYTATTVILFGRFLYNLFILNSQTKIPDKIFYKGEYIRLVNGNVGPYSFFKTIFIGKGTLKNGEIDNDLLVHEIAHKQQLHSIDIVLMELLCVFYWFNPFIYLFKKLIKTNHEYLADDFVIKSGIDRKKYSNKLIDLTFRNKTLNLASGFNYLLIKNRIIMLSKSEQKKRLVFPLAMILLIIAMLFVTTAFTNSDKVFNLNPTDSCKIETYQDENRGGYIINGDKQEIFFRDDGNRGYIYFISKNGRGRSYTSNMSDTVTHKLDNYIVKEYKGQVFVDDKNVGLVKKGDIIILHHDKKIDVHNRSRVKIKDD